MQHHGSTDPMVILNTLEYYGIPQEVTSFPLLSEQYVLLQIYICEVKICSAWKSFIIICATVIAAFLTGGGDVCCVLW